MAGCDAEVCHSDNAVLNNGGALNYKRVAGAGENLAPEAAVYFLYNLINTRYAAFYKLLRPAFKRFRHYGMVGVSDSTCYKLPRLIPAVAAFVKQKAHKLRNRESRVGVVYVYSYLFGQVVKRVVAA